MLRKDSLLIRMFYGSGTDCVVTISGIVSPLHHVWQSYSIGGPLARFGPRRALGWPLEAYRKWDKFAKTTPENTDILIGVSQSKSVRKDTK